MQVLSRGELINLIQGSLFAATEMSEIPTPLWDLALTVLRLDELSLKHEDF